MKAENSNIKSETTTLSLVITMFNKAVIQWIPAYNNIQGNEEDRLAKDEEYNSLIEAQYMKKQRTDYSSYIKING